MRSGSSTPTGRRSRAPTELRAAGGETEVDVLLREARAALDREKLRTVASYPFVGRAMRFESDTAVLQITNDGRFSFSTFPAGPTPAEVSSGVRKHSPRVVAAFEGVFCGSASATRESSLVAAAAALAPKDDPKASAAHVAAGASNPAAAAAAIAADSASQTVEGLAVLRHEAEECLGESRLFRVERGEFRFAISVSPFYDPVLAMVQPLGAGAAERPQVLSVSIPEAQRPLDLHRAAPPRLIPLPPHDWAPRRSRGTLLRFSPPDLQKLPDSGGSPAGSPLNAIGRGSLRDSANAVEAKKILLSSVSAPHLTEELKDPTGWSVDQWRDHFRTGIGHLKEPARRRRAVVTEEVSRLGGSVRFGK